MTNSWLRLIGTYLVIEATVSLFWKHNDKSLLGQFARVSRMLAGSMVIWLGRYRP